MQDFEDAEALFRSIAASYPDQEKLGYALARVEFRAGKISESLETLRGTIAAGHESSELYNLLGWCLHKKDDAKGAVAALDRAIALDFTEESNYVDVGIISLKNRRFDGAMAADKAIEAAPGSSAGRQLKGQRYVRRDQRPVQQPEARANGPAVCVLKSGHATGRVFLSG